MLALWTALARTRRAMGAAVLLSVAMITAMPVMAITLGGECEKQCCRRKASGHACCKRSKADSAAAFVAAQGRCCAGNANVGLTRLTVSPGVERVQEFVIGLAVAGDVPLVLAARVETVLAGHALFERPPPVL